MTKRAAIVIAIILIIPIAVTFHFYNKWKSDNPVVAEWKGDTSVVSFRNLELTEVVGSSEYRFRTGKYVGKISDRLTGPSLYRIEGDDTFALYAVVDSSRRRIFTAGEPLPAGAFSGEKVTGVFTGSGVFGDSEKLTSAVALILSDRSEPVLLESGELEKISTCDLYVCYDGSCVSAKKAGSVAGPTERGRWYFLPADGAESAAESAAETEAETAGKGADEDAGTTVYEIVSADAVSAIKAFLSGVSAEDTTSQESSSGD